MLSYKYNREILTSAIFFCNSIRVEIFCIILKRKISMDTHLLNRTTTNPLYSKMDSERFWDFKVLNFDTKKDSINFHLRLGIIKQQ